MHNVFLHIYMYIYIHTHTHTLINKHIFWCFTEIISTTTMQRTHSLNGKIKRVAVGEKRERCVKLESFLSRRLKRWDLPGMCRRCFAGTFTQVNGCHSGFGRNLRWGENETCGGACDGGVEQPAPSLSLAAGQEAQVNVGVKRRYAAARVFVSVPAASEALGCGGWSYFRCRVVT